jgi:hypothetical protein
MGGADEPTVMLDAQLLRMSTIFDRVSQICSRGTCYPAQTFPEALGYRSNGPSSHAAELGASLAALLISQGPRARATLSGIEAWDLVNDAPATIASHGARPLYPRV